MRNSLEQILFKMGDHLPDVKNFKTYLSNGVHKLKSNVKYSLPVAAIFLGLTAACARPSPTQPTPPIAPPQRTELQTPTPFPTPLRIPQYPTVVATPTPTSIRFRDAYTPVPRNLLVQPTPTPPPTPLPPRLRRNISIQNLYVVHSGNYQTAISFDMFNGGDVVAENIPFTVTVDGEEQGISCPYRVVKRVQPKTAEVITCTFTNPKNKTKFPVRVSTQYVDDIAIDNESEIPFTIRYKIELEFGRGKVESISYPTDATGFIDTSSLAFVYKLTIDVINAGRVPSKKSKLDFISLTKDGYQSICDPTTIESLEGLEPGKRKAVSCTTVPILSASVTLPSIYGNDLDVRAIVTGLPSGEEVQLIEKRYILSPIKPLISAEFSQDGGAVFLYGRPSAIQTFMSHGLILTGAEVKLIKSGNPLTTPVIRIKKADNGSDEVLTYKDGKGRELRAEAKLILIGPDRYYAPFAGVPLVQGRFSFEVGCTPCTGLDSYGLVHSKEDAYSDGRGFATSSGALEGGKDFYFRLFGFKR